MRHRTALLTLLTSLGLAVAPAAALADSGTTLSLSGLPSSASTGTTVPFEVDSSYSNGPNGSQLMTVFFQPPADGACPATATPPSNANVLLTEEPADQVLVVDGVSAPLDLPGLWTLCAYLTSSGSVSASASQPVTLTGAAISSATPDTSSSSGSHPGSSGSKNHSSKTNKKTKHTSKKRKKKRKKH
jgi:hypothetical protein